MRTFLLASLISIGGCAVPESPPAITLPEGVYLAESAGNSLLPAVVLEVPDISTAQPMKVYLVADTLEIQGGTYRQRGHLETRLEGQLVGRLIWPDHGRFTVSGGVAAFESEYLQNVAFTTELGFPTLRVTQDLTGEAPPTVHVFRLVSR